MALVKLTLWFAGLVMVTCNDPLAGMPQIREMMKNPKLRDQVEAMLQKQGMDISKFEEIVEISGLMSDCELEKFLNNKDDPNRPPSGSKSSCCETLVAFECMLSKSQVPIAMKLVAKMDIFQCEQYLMNPLKCDLHIDAAKLLQFQSLACYIDIVRPFGGTIHECCVQNFQEQCFAHNFGEECKRTVASHGLACDQVVKIEPHCSNALPNCPSYRVHNLEPNFFTSTFFYVSIAVTVGLFVFLYFLCVQCNKPDNSYEINNRDGTSNKGSNSPSPSKKTKKKTKGKKGRKQ